MFKLITKSKIDMKKMKLLPSAVLVANLMLCAVFSSCSEIKSKDWSKYKFGVTIYGGKGFGGGFSSIYCDSLQMTGLLSADVWVDGIKMTVKAQDRISVWSNGN